jgi:hypothetical protein
MSLTMQEAFAKAGLVSKEELEKKEKDRLKAQQEAKSKFEENSKKIKEEKLKLLKEGAKEGTLSPTQIENWRRILFNQFGPASDIQKLKDNIEKIQ